MSKIIASLAILSLCVSVASAAYASTDTTTSQMSLVSSTYLNSTATKVYSGASTTDYTTALWQSVPSGMSDVVFGPASTNSTVYAYGIQYASSAIAKVIRRSLNATLVGYGNDTSEASVIGTDMSIATSSLTSVTSFNVAVGPGYLAILSTGTVGTSVGVQVTIINNAGSATTVTVSANTGTTAFTSYTLGNIFYDIASGVFFFAYAGAGSGTPVAALYVGGVTASTAAVYWTAPGLAITLPVVANGAANIVAGNDNWVNSSNIYVAWKDTTTGISYYSKTARSANTTSTGTATTIATDVTSGGTYPYKTYVPIGVWASNYTYGIACALNTLAASGGTHVYTIQNFLNGTVSNTNDSGITLSGVTAQATSLWGWMLNTGYTLLAEWTPASGSGMTYTIGTFYANGTVNGTAPAVGTLAANLQGPLNVFEDLNGTQWIGWTDIDTTASLTFNGYLAKLQGQLNPASSSGNVLTALMAFVAFCLVAVFAF